MTWYPLLLSTGLAAAVTAVWFWSVEPERLRGWHAAMISGQAPAPNQYRILMPALAEGIRRLTDLPLAASYALVLALANLASLFLFQRLCECWLAPRQTRLAAAILAVLIAVTYAPRVIQLSDAVNLAVVIAGLLAIRRGKDAHLFWLLPLGAVNRESVLVLAGYYLAIRWQDQRSRALMIFAGLTCEWLLAYGAVRLGFGSRAYYCDVIMLRANLTDAWAYLSVLSFLGPFLVASWRPVAGSPVLLTRAMRVVAPYIVLHYVVALVAETRLFLPLMPVLIPLTLIRDEAAIKVRPRRQATA